MEGNDLRIEVEEMEFKIRKEHEEGVIVEGPRAERKRNSDSAQLRGDPKCIMTTYDCDMADEEGEPLS